MIARLSWFSQLYRTLTYKAFLSQAPRVYCELIMWPISACSGCPLRSLYRHDLFVPRSRATTAQQRAYVCLGWSSPVE